MIRELDRVVLTTDLGDLDLKAGDIGTVVLVHDAGRGFEVEFVTLDGQSIGVTTLTVGQVRPVHRNEIAHARLVPSA
jgi:hypothetical protein